MDLLTLPVLGIPRLVRWMAEKLVEEAERQEFGEDQLQARLLDLQLRQELGEIDDAEYEREEGALLKRLSYIRSARGKA